MNGTLTLAIESGIENGSLSLMDGSSVLATWYGQPGLAASEKLLPAIADLLNSGGWDIYAVGRVAVSRGPGSYTGVRVGLATALGLSRSRGIPCIGIDLMKAIYSRFGNGLAAICAIPIGRNGLCWTYFPASGDALNQGILGTGDRDDFVESMRSKRETPIFAHSLVRPLLSAGDEFSDDPAIFDVGRNMAIYIGEASLSFDDGLEPIYARTMTFATTSGENVVK